ncbi:HTH-type transcriptional regulator GltC [Variibacter gotjawalensis]|uniref:HTH-type transcriptional regulator GltC n=1 Tax=Variibacter gotjawalensis TaxID=1333996 RepID=A0A0S3Q006_9BRAD|nr:LysR family transcriptional regulator [Variibacter gotjawalensis]NIK47382.1 DNA-binding transcriptional LysR family regulator [Variibacter gotjawalensis]RZS49278.1 LysR family transcriptional regulator [Variibacter gotjawalensis]BAT61542.1 HTH-type transcriptional regulator GltC [Variibacter gotjawalensis]
MSNGFDNLDWDDLRVFLHVARTGNLTQAARRLRIDPSTVSRRIAQLESSLGLAVFQRQRVGLKLSEIGESLLRHIETMESALVSFREQVGAEETSVGGTVRLATMEGIASLYLAERLGGLKKIAPELTIELITSSQTVHVNRREADLFLSFFKPPGQGLVSEKIGGFLLKLYASEEYLEAHGTPADAAALQEHVFVSYVEDLIQVDSVRWLRDVIEAPNVSFHSTSMIAQTTAAAGGLGIVLLPTFSVSRCPELKCILDGKVQTGREVWLNVHTDLQFSPRIRTVTAFLKKLFKSDPAMHAY